MLLSSNKPEFWIINITDKNVCLADLAFTMPAKSSFNLLDEKHFSYTIEQIKLSLESGSLYKKRNMIKLGKGPTKKQEQRIEVSNRPFKSRKRSTVKVVAPNYDEFLFTDEEFAVEMSDPEPNKK